MFKKTNTFIGLIIISLVFSINTVDQIPYSFKNNIYTNIETITMPELDMNALLEEDENAADNIPLRFGYKFNVDYNMLNSGTWEEFEDGSRLWRLQIHSLSAYGIKFLFNKFNLPEGSELYIYNIARDMILGPFTNEDNHEDNKFGHRLIKGDNIILEYYESSSVLESPEFNISSVIHAYRDIHNFSNENRDRDCGDNVACSSADDWEDQANSSIYLEMNQYICSAALINNTAQDKTPYVLTAWHCVESDGNLGSHNNFTFYFNHETSSCSGNSGYYGHSETGSYIRAWGNMSSSDYALLEMDDDPASWWDPYFSGWSRYSSQTAGAGVHHPGGDPKKINFDNDQTSSCNWYGSGGTHHCLNWDDGGTAGGSSGSPLFNSSKLIIGQLSGGSGGECGNGTDYYGKISTSWSGLDNYLDPLGTNTYTLQGTYDGGSTAEVTVEYPNGGEIFEGGSTVTIQWEDNFNENASIILYKSGSALNTITSSTSSDGSYNWSVSESLAEGNDYQIKITSVNDNLVNDFGGYFSITQPAPPLGDVTIYFGEHSAYDQIIDIMITTPGEVSGYQFNFTDVPDYISISDAFGGITEQEGFTISTSSNTVIAFSLTGSTIPDGTHLLTTLSYTIEDDCINCNSTYICFENPIVSDPLGNPYPTETGGCESIDLNSSILGDLNADGIINILDVVSLVNIVLSNEYMSSGDLNNDGVIDILDIVALVNIVIES